MTPRNLLFLFSDQHAAHIMGCAGDSYALTPSLDSLAARGVRMTNAYCPSPICTPSRMSMLTGCHPSDQECWTNDDVLASDRPTWLHALGATGIKSGLVGRMHSIGPDQMRGYAWREVGDHSPNFPGVTWHNMGVLQGTNEPTPESVVACGVGQSAYEVKDHDTTKAALEALDRLALSGERFAMTVGFMLPHAPYVASRKWVDHFMKVLPPPEIPVGASDTGWIAWWRKNRGIENVPERQSRLARAAYWGLVAVLDEMIGRILSRLESLGLLEDTLVVYASDHGDHVGERGLWWKHSFYDESVKVPMILAHRSLSRGIRDEVVSLIDLAATMTEAMGAEALPDSKGRSFWPLLTKGHQEWENSVFSEYCTDAVPDWTGGRAVQQRMLREGQWKLHYYHGETPHLYNLLDDPKELNNLAGLPAHAVQRDAMLERLLDGWNPEAVRITMERRRKNKDILASWASNIRPTSTYLWPLEPSMNRLDID